MTEIVNAIPTDSRRGLVPALSSVVSSTEMGAGPGEATYVFDTLTELSPAASNSARSVPADFECGNIDQTNNTLESVLSYHEFPSNEVPHLVWLSEKLREHEYKGVTMTTWCEDQTATGGGPLSLFPKDETQRPGEWVVTDAVILEEDDGTHCPLLVAVRAARLAQPHEHDWSTS
jgi:hypothetical protein